MRRVTPTAAFGLILACLLFTACDKKEAKAGKPTTGAQKTEAPPVQVCEVTRESMRSLLEVTSKLESEREIMLHPELSGTAIEILAEEGDLVQKGQVLARMDRRDEALALRDAKVALKEAQDGKTMADLAVEEAIQQVGNLERAAEQAARDYGRDLALSKSRDVVSPLSVQALETKKLDSENALHAKDQAEIALRRKRLDLLGADTAIERALVSQERAELNLTKKDVLAPFAGVISSRNIREGDSIGPSTEAFVLTDISRLRTVFSRPQEELALFGSAGTSARGDGATDGLALSATAEAYPGQQFEGWVERISPTIDPDSGQFSVIARLRSGAQATLLPGMLLRMQIVTDQHDDTLVIPKRALRRQGDKRYVLVVEGEPGEDSRPLRRVDVREGFQNESHLEIIALNPSELSEGMQIVVVGSRELKHGGRVKVDQPGALDQGQAPEADEEPLQDGSPLQDESDVADSPAAPESNG